MSILVVCPGCHKRFKVSDQYAGQTGACPKCKGAIKVPSKEEEVTVHAPEEFDGGGRTTTGKLITKPITRQETKLEPLQIVAIVGAAVTVLLMTWVAGGAIAGSLVVRGAGLLLVSPLLVLAAYTFLRDDELEPYRAAPLYVRCAVCALGYAVLWGVFGYLDAQGIITGELWAWLFVIPPFLVTGGLMSVACLDLEFGNGCFHYGFYLLMTVLLRWIAGMGWVWEIGVATPL